jgi:hypothetical protein
MNEEIGNAAGTIWSALHAHGELTLKELKEKSGLKTPMIDWAIGWLAREGNVVLTAEKKIYRVRLK